MAVVSYSFNHPERVAETTRDRVLVAAREIGYSGPDPAARALRTGRTGVIALHFAPAAPGERLPSRVVHVLAGALGACAESDISITIPAGDARPACDGAIVIAGQDVALSLEVPYVRVGPDEPGADNLVAPDPTAIDAAFAAIAERGHRRLAIVADPMVAPWFERRGRAWPGGARVIAATPESYERGRAVGRELLSEGRRPTAIMVIGTELAVGVQGAMQELGLSAPEDVSLITVGDSDSFPPAMTGVRVPQRELGVRAVEHLRAVLDGGEGGRADPVPCDFQIGTTLGPPAAD